MECVSARTLSSVPPVPSTRRQLRGGALVSPHYSLDLTGCASATVCAAHSFNQQLGGAWATSTADQDYMFNGCRGGSIVGKTNNGSGTPK